MASVGEELRKRVYGSANPTQSQISAVRQKANTLAPGAQEAIDRHTNAVKESAARPPCRNSLQHRKAVLEVLDGIQTRECFVGRWEECGGRLYQSGRITH